MSQSAVARYHLFFPVERQHEFHIFFSVHILFVSIVVDAVGMIARAVLSKVIHPFSLQHRMCASK